MNILITGSRGMLGKELVKLLNKKHKIIEFDSLIGDDILSEKKLRKKMSGVEVVIHLAGIIDDNSSQLWRVNVSGTKKVLQEAIRAKAKKFVFLSSTGVYGETSGITSEKTELNPTTLYEKSKAEAEKIVLKEKDNISVSIIRSAMIFGANNYWKKMFNLLKKKYPLPLSGKNTFQIIYSKELARIIEIVMKKGESGEIYLVAGQEKKSLNEFCNLIQAEMGLEKKLMHIPLTIGLILGKLFGIKILTKENVRHLAKERKYNTSKIKKLGWKQKYSLKEAIKKVVKELN
ncbi:MAG: short chain dehydrogenase [archaeon ADurb.Bin336]|nr:MAG: short chain dehydrogenase [archaeon ADurb.Bin336]